MEAFAQALQDALGTQIAVYLGAEWAERQAQLPFVVVLPVSASYATSNGERRSALADVRLQVMLLCKAVTFEEAVTLADLCYVAAPGRDAAATIRLRSEPWGDYTVRVADLTLTLPAV